MSERYVISDTHFGHSNILTFTTDAGVPMRVFESVEAMDEHMIDRWNAVVKPGDVVYHLGDVAIPRSGLQQLSRLNGRKRLIKGNHDIFKLKDYTPYFEDILSYKLRDNLFMSHIPVHPTELRYEWVNIHGHTHSNNTFDYFGPRYFNVSVEMIDYTPMEWSILRERVKAHALLCAEKGHTTK